MGNKNHLLPLMLIDPSLQGIDTKDPTLSMQVKAKIIMECSKNPWYYFREVVKAPAQSGGNDRPFKFSRGNFAMYWMFFNHITTINIWPRQRGKSFCSDVLATYLMNVACTNTSMQLLTKDDHLRGTNIKRLREIDACLPSYISRQDRFDSKNASEYTVNLMGNHYKGHLPSTSPKRAYLVGRGLTSPIFFIDEPVFQPNISISMPSALTAGTAAREMAEEASSPYGTILTTTAGKQDDRDGKFIYNLTKEAAVMTEKFYDLDNLVDLEKAIRGAGKGNLRVNCTYNHRQLGVTDQQLNKAIEEAVVNGEDMLRDFYNVWTNGGSASPFEMDTINALVSGKMDPVWVQINGDSYTTRWYKDEKTIHRILETGDAIVGLDTSDAIGKDDMALVVRQLSTGEVVGVGTYNTTNIITFSKWLFEKWFMPYPKLVAIIERRSTANSIIDYLLLMLHQVGRNPFKQLFNWVFDKSTEHAGRFKEVSEYKLGKQGNLHVKYKKFVGFATSGSGATSRTSLYHDTLMSAVGDTATVLHDIGLIDQLLGLQIRNNRVDHGPGGHDDIVIALLMTQWFITRAINVKAYGLNPLNIMSEINIPGDTAVDVEVREADKELRIEIDDVMAIAKGTQHPLLINRLQRKLTILTSKLTVADDYYNIDILIAEMRALSRLNAPKEKKVLSKLDRVRRSARLTR